MVLELQFPLSLTGDRAVLLLQSRSKVAAKAAMLLQQLQLLRASTRSEKGHSTRSLPSRSSTAPAATATMAVARA